ncbi:MAG TPA: MoaD family protein [Firmicutes bacterium]|nr:MoaD family protein [Bacillota bacterium]
MVRVLFFAGIREITRAKETKVAAGSVEELLRELAARYGPKFQSAVYGPDGLSREAILILNGRHLAHLPDGLKTKLVPGDTVSIFPLVAGG